MSDARMNAMGDLTIPVPVPQNSPPFPSGENSLNDRQRPVMEMMLAGKSESAIAREAGMDRKTIYNWRTGHDAFRRELARRRRALWAGAGDRLRALLHPALDVLESQLAERYDR